MQFSTVGLSSAGVFCSAFRFLLLGVVLSATFGHPIGALAQPFSEAKEISTSAPGAREVHASDVDGDGDTDVLSADYGDDTITWYEQDDGSEATFTSRDLTGSADGANSVHTADVNGDGHTDILYSSRLDGTVAWFENDGSADPSFTEHELTTSADDPRSAYGTDLDGDGDLDIIVPLYGSGSVVWYENDGGENPSFTKQTITTSAGAATDVYPADVDGDGHTDVVTAALAGDEVAWHENDGSDNPSFTKHQVTTSASQVRSVFAADLDDDGDTDLLSASPGDNTVAWYENDGTADPAFTTREITTSADGAHDVFAANLDVNGSVDHGT